MNIISKLKKSGLEGRGGAGFPTWIKWASVEKAMADKSGNGEGKKCYVVSNAAEGEPGIKKDGFILENHPERVIDGIKIAVNFFGAEKAYIYINPKYYKKYSDSLRRIIGDFPIELFVKPEGSGYIGGEESAILNAIEGKRIEPRLRPPFPVEKGLFGYPTLLNNVETFYCVSLIFADQYKKNRFYSIEGDCLHEGVYEFPENWTIEKVIKESGNYPDFPFFVQVGGGAAGEVLASSGLKKSLKGAGSIIIYSTKKTDPQKLLKKWLNFFREESCGQCVPCREGIFRMWEILNTPKPNWELFFELADNLSETSFCGLGCALPLPIKSLLANVMTKPK